MARRRTGSHQSTVAKAKERKHNQVTRNIAAAFMFLVVAGILGAIIYFILAKSESDTYVYYIYSESTQAVIDQPHWTSGAKRSLKSVDFAANDRERIEKAFGLDTSGQVFFKTYPISSDESFNAKLEEIKKDVGEDNHLILYFAMDGIAKQGEDGDLAAFLRNPTSTKVDIRVDSLLKSVATLPCKSRLFLFETGCTDLRVNHALQDDTDEHYVPMELAFEHCLVDALTGAVQGGAENTWAICSNRAFEKSNYLRGLQGSVFGMGFANALEGWLTKGRELFVERLYVDMLTFSQQHTFVDKGVYRQLPLLVNCHEGKIVKAVEANERRDSTMNQVAWAKVKSAAANDEDGEEEAAQFTEIEFVPIWELVRTIEERTEQKPYSPIDFCPERWSMLVDQLIDVQVQHWSLKALGLPTPKLTDYQTELTKLLAVLNKEPDPQDERVFVDRLIKDIAADANRYIVKWDENTKSNNKEAVDRQILVTHSLHVGQAHDHAFRLRVALFAFDELASPSFGNAVSTSYSEWNQKSKAVDRLAQLRAKPQTVRPFGLSEHSFAEFEKRKLRDSRSIKVYEDRLLEFVLTNYLRREYSAPTAPESKRLLDEAAIDFLEFDHVNQDEFDTFCMPKLNLIRNLTTSNQERLFTSSDLKSTSFQNWELFALKLRRDENGPDVFFRRQLGLDKSYLDCRKRLEHMVTANFQESHAYSPPSIQWDEIIRTMGDINVVRTNGCEFDPNDNESWLVDLWGLKYEAVLNLTTKIKIESGNAADESRIDWRLHQRNEQSDAGTQTLEQDGVQVRLVDKGNKECDLFLISEKTRQQPLRPIKFFLSAGAKNPDLKIKRQFVKLTIHKPPHDEYQVEISNHRIRETNPMLDRRAVGTMTRGSISSAKDTSLVINPITGLDSQFNVRIKSSTKAQRNVKVDVYSYKLVKGRPGKMPEQSEFDTIEEFPNLFQPLTRSMKDAEEKKAGFYAQLNEWQDLSLAKTEGNGPANIKGALLFVLTEEATSQKWYQWVELDRIPAGKLINVNTTTYELTLADGYNIIVDEAKATSHEMKRSEVAYPDGFSMPFMLNSSDASWTIVPSDPKRDGQLIYDRVLLDFMSEPRALLYKSTGNRILGDRDSFQVGFDLTGRENLRKGLIVERSSNGRDWTYLLQDELNRNENKIVLQIDGLPKNRSWSVPTVFDRAQPDDRSVKFDFSSKNNLFTIVTKASDYLIEVDDGGRSKRSFDVNFDGQKHSSITIIQNAKLAREPVLKLNKTRRYAGQPGRIEAIIEGTSDFPKHCWIDLEIAGQPVIEKLELRNGAITRDISEFVKEVGKYELTAIMHDKFGEKSVSDPVSFQVLKAEENPDVAKNKEAEEMVNPNAVGTVILEIAPDTKKIKWVSIGGQRINDLVVGQKGRIVEFEGRELEVTFGLLPWEGLLLFPGEKAANWLL